MKQTIDPAVLAGVFRAFDTRADFREALPYGTGHINDTFKVAADQGGAAVPFTLQRLNTAIFKRPETVMGNIVQITRHLAARLAGEGAADATRRALQVVPTRAGEPFLRAGDGSCWRLYVFIDQAFTVDQVEQVGDARAAAFAFGRFQRLLADLPGGGGSLAETIPGFHDTRGRYAAFKRAVAADPRGRAASVRPEIDFALAHEPLADILPPLVAHGDIPVRATHNDTKVNNVLLDERTREGICVIDLDTCMPGLALYDFGDMVRAGTNTAAEDTTQPETVASRADVFAALADGFLRGAGCLTEAEIAHLPLGGQLMTLECGVRFLTDYLEGDVYFKTHRPGQNLDRCRGQFALVVSQEKQYDSFRKIVARAAAAVRAGG